MALRVLDAQFDADDGDNKFEDGLLAPADTELAATASSVYPDIRGTSGDQIRMIIDAILNSRHCPSLRR